MKLAELLPFKRPDGFHPAGRVTWARLLPENVSPFRNLKNGGNYTPAQRRGKKYEDRILRHLAGTFPSLLIGPWLQFSTNGVPHYCQPDAVLIDDLCLTIFEVKLSHSLRAYHQLVELYAPVLLSALGPLDVRLVEITRSFDPDVRIPGPLTVHLDFAEYLEGDATRWAQLSRRHPIEVIRWKL